MKTHVLLVATALTFGLLVPGARAGDGAAVFKAQCAKCHGETGLADTAPGKALKTPPLAGDAKVAGASVDELVTSIKGNKKHESFIKKISDQDVTDAAAFVKELAGKK